MERNVHVTDNVRVNEGALVVAFELFAAYARAVWFMPVAFCGEWGGLRADGVVYGPYWRLVVCQRV